MLVARMLQPVIRRSPAYAHRQALRTEGLRESAVDLVLLMLTRHGTSFDPRITIVNRDLLPPTPCGRPMLLVGPHTSLSLMILRVLADSGLPHLIISAGPMRVAGRSEDVPVIIPSPTMFLRLRRQFANGGHVGAMIDRAGIERRTVPLPTAGSDLFVSTGLLEFGLRCNARVVFIGARLDERWNVVLDLHEPRQSSIDELLGEVGEFFPPFMRLG